MLDKISCNKERDRKFMKMYDDLQKESLIKVDVSSAIMHNLEKLAYSTGIVFYDPNKHRYSYRIDQICLHLDSLSVYKDGIDILYALHHDNRYSSIKEGCIGDARGECRFLTTASPSFKDSEYEEHLISCDVLKIASTSWLGLHLR